MSLLVGASEGLFIVGKGSEPTPVEGLAGRSVRRIVAVGGDLLAGASDGVYRSADGGRSWQPSGVEGQIVWDIQPAPGDEDVVYAGTQPAALYRSADRGCTWQAIGSVQAVPGAERWCIPNSNLGARARTIVLDPADPARCWLGIEVGGVLASEDGGGSWSLGLPGGNPDIHVMARHPARPSTLFATTGYGRIDNSEPMAARIAGLFGSEDGGRSWRYLWEGVEPRYTRPICIDERAPHPLTVACAPTAFSSFRDEGGAHSLLYRSDDDGRTWRSLGDAAHSPSAANILSVTPGEAVGDVLVGTDTGEVWNVSAAGGWTLLAAGLPMVQAVARVG